MFSGENKKESRSPTYNGQREALDEDFSSAVYYHNIFYIAIVSC